jgi:hypothetical protein
MNIQTQTLTLALALFASHMARAESPCEARMDQAALSAYANEHKLPLAEAETSAVIPGSWTEMTANNTGFNEYQITRKDSLIGPTAMVLVEAKQIGATDSCKVIEATVTQSAE